ncbi:DUF6291 domain-containing protein [uncultured Oscillibacter sp.]|uniref:DUF6291 domain-containing protein n=1 Tax=uncultured Oscillibacter sp. TaxID=876091 RepID=UPI0025D5D052|nr:DUF6291 domain-containing protein [uncultured Oscillibacter sp.]
MPREYFCAYHSYIESMEQLTDAERGRLFTACLFYSKTGEAPQLSGNERFVFPAMRSQIDRDIQNYEDFVKKQSENGKKGGRPRKPTESQKTQCELCWNNYLWGVGGGTIEMPKEERRTTI